MIAMQGTVPESAGALSQYEWFLFRFCQGMSASCSSRLALLEI